MTHDQLIEELKKLDKLLTSGALTEAEFKEMKLKLLAQMKESNELEPTVAPSCDDAEDISHQESDSLEYEKNTSWKAKLLSKRSLIIFSSLALLLCLALFFIFSKSNYQKALEKIEEQHGKILANEDDSGAETLIYVTPEGLYYWDLKNKEPQKLFENVDSLVEILFYLDKNFKPQISTSKYEKEIVYYAQDENGNQPNVLQSSDQMGLYKVKWPWVLVGQHYVVNVNHPNHLINIHGFNKGDVFEGLPNLYYSGDPGDTAPSYVDIDGSGNLALKLGRTSYGLPGYQDYRPKNFDKDTWIDHYYIDPYLVRTYGIYFDNYFEIRNIMGIDLPEDPFVFRNVTLTSENKIIDEKKVTWDGYDINDSDLTKTGMEPIYEDIEQKYLKIINEQLPEKKAAMEKYEVDQWKSILSGL